MPVFSETSPLCPSNADCLSAMSQTLLRKRPLKAGGIPGKEGERTEGKEEMFAGDGQFWSNQYFGCGDGFMGVHTM